MNEVPSESSNPVESADTFVCGAVCLLMVKSSIWLANALAIMAVLGSFIGSQTGRPWSPDDWIPMVVFGVYGIHWAGSGGGGAKIVRAITRKGNDK